MRLRVRVQGLGFRLRLIAGYIFSGKSSLTLKPRPNTLNPNLAAVKSPKLKSGLSETGLAIQGYPAHVKYLALSDPSGLCLRPYGGPRELVFMREVPLYNTLRTEIPEQKGQLKRMCGAVLKGAGSSNNTTPLKRRSNCFTIHRSNRFMYTCVEVQSSTVPSVHLFLAALINNGSAQ